MPDINSERVFQRQHIIKQKAKYLATDIRKKVNNDSGYRYKVELLEKSIQGTKGYILDLGSNTCGEAEYLVNKGYNVVASDINEVGLTLSNQRTKLYGYDAPKYYVFDAHKIPFAENTFDCIIASEVLHHFENLDLVLQEIKRVLKKGGKLIAIEPYAYNPYRRLSEIPHYLFTGSIERSFSIKEIKKILKDKGLLLSTIEMIVIPPSIWKMKYQSKIRNIKQKIYYFLAKTFPKVLGLLYVIAKKDGIPDNIKIDSLQLICPRSGNPLQKMTNGYICKNDEKYIYYQNKEGIHILVSEDSVLLSQVEFDKL